MIRFAHLLYASSLVLALVPRVGFAQQVVGAVGAANAAPTGRAPGQATRALKPGGDIFFKDRIATKRGGSAQLTFLDRSTLSIGENSDLIIDEFVYDPGASGTMRATLSKGVLRFVGGDISHGGGATVNTPAVTIGIRGGIGTIAYVKDGADLDAIPGVPANFQGGTIVVNGYGQMTVRNRASEVVLSRPGFAVFVGSTGESIAAPVRLDPKATQVLMKALASKGRQHGGASTKMAAAFAGAGIGHLIEVPVALPQLPRLDALDFTSVFSAGNALARNQSQSNQASQLHLQIVRAAAASMAPTTIPTTITVATSNIKPATVATITASTPAASTASTPAMSPASTPAMSPASTPATTSASTPAMSTANTPAMSPASTPAMSPASTPATTSASTPAMSTASTPAMSPASTPAMSPASTPATTSASTPAMSTASTPAMSPASTPATTSASTPAMSTASTPATISATTPATTSASTPATMTASTPATMTASTPATTTTTSVQTVYDINVAVVTADVIYAHMIDSGNIQAKQVIVGNNYGSTSGSTVNGSNLTTTGQLNAHDIHAGTVIANVIYVDGIDD